MASPRASAISAIPKQALATAKRPLSALSGSENGLPSVDSQTNDNKKKARLEEFSLADFKAALSKEHKQGEPSEAFVIKLQSCTCAIALTIPLHPRAVSCSNSNATSLALLGSHTFTKNSESLTS